jgi:antitoxin component of MazEF toxin-antitoxin module
MKSVYVVQPYQVGSKRAKSLAMVIPAKVVKKFNIDASTIFTLRPTDKREIQLRVMEEFKVVHTKAAAAPIDKEELSE